MRTVRSEKIIKSKWDIIFECVVGFILILIGLMILIPILHVIFASISDPSFVRNYKSIIFYPRSITLRGYGLVFQNTVIVRSIFNTLLYVCLGVSLNMVVTVVAAYVLSFREPLWNKFFMKLITVTMFFSGGLIPLFHLLDNMNLLNTAFAVLLPAAMNAWNMIILRTAFRGIPDSLMDAAKLDGASYVKMLIHIVIPVSLPTIAIIFMYYVSGHWNEWFSYMAFISDRNKYPLQLILREILVINDTTNVMPGDPDLITGQETKVLVQYCAAIISVIPMLVFFPFVQKYFMTGVLVGSLKG